MWGDVYESYCKAVEKVYKHRDLILCCRKLNVAQIVNLSHTLHHNGKLHTVVCLDKVLLAFYIAALKTLARDSSLYLLRSFVVGTLIPIALLSSQLLATNPVYQTLTEVQSAISVPRPSFKLIHFLDQTEICGSLKVWTVSPIVTSNLDYEGW